MSQLCALSCQIKMFEKSGLIFCWCLNDYFFIKLDTFVFNQDMFTVIHKCNFFLQNRFCWDVKL